LDAAAGLAGEGSRPLDATAARAGAVGDPALAGEVGPLDAAAARAGAGLRNQAAGAVRRNPAAAGPVPDARADAGQAARAGAIGDR
jgi:hypothetical protein